MNLFKRIMASVLLILTAITPVSASAGELLWWSTEIVNVQHERSVEEIVAMARKLPHSAFNPTVTRYEVTPSFKAPYSAGSLNKDDLNDALNAVKMVRYLAGLPYENIKFTDELNNIAQHGSVLLAASNQFSHNPLQPSDMDDTFYDLGYQGCSEANINAGRSNLSAAVLGFIFDNGANNIERAGHRRWILKPGAENFGMGFARNSGASYQGCRINMHVFDGLGYWECESDSYISWPPSGNFPIQYFAASSYIGNTIVAPWSINLGYPYEEPSKDDITLTLTRKSDNKVWTFDKSTPNLGIDGLSDNTLHLAVDNGGYGITKAIIFRPDPDSLGVIKDGETFTVELSGISYTDGSPATLKYDINFFDLDEALNKTNVTLSVTDGTASISDACVYINDEVYKTNSDGKLTLPAVIGKSYSCTVSKAGYNTKEYTFSVTEADSTIAVTLTPYTVTRQSGKIKITMIPVSSEKTGIIIGALYNGDTLVAADKVSGASSKITLTLTDKEATCIKLFHLESIKNLTPVKEVAVINLP